MKILIWCGCLFVAEVIIALLPLKGFLPTTAILVAACWLAKVWSGAVEEKRNARAAVEAEKQKDDNKESSD